MEANLLRNFKALDCFLLSLPYLQSKKIIKYTLLNILGATFHISSLLYLPLFFILTVNIHKYVIWIIFIVITLIYWLKIHVTSSIIGYILAGSEKYVGYLESDSGFGFTLGYFERTFTFLLFTFLYKRLIIQKKSNNIFYNCSFLYYSFHILFNDIAVVAERIPFLFIIGNWVLYTNVINCKYRAKQVINVAIGILVFLKIVLSFSNIGTKYQNILFGIDSYESRAKECLEIAIDFDNGRNH